MRTWGAFIALTAGVQAHAATLEHTFEFAAPWSDEAPDKALATTRAELHPKVPVRIARILLPKGETLERVEVTTGGDEATRFEPKLMAQQLPLTEGAAVAR